MATHLWPGGAPRPLKDPFSKTLVQKTVFAKGELWFISVCSVQRWIQREKRRKKDERTSLKNEIRRSKHVRICFGEKGPTASVEFGVFNCE